MASPVKAPVLDGDVAGSSTGAVSLAQKTQFLHFGGEKADVGEFEDEVPQAVVSRDSVARLLAA